MKNYTPKKFDQNHQIEEAVKDLCLKQSEDGKWFVDDKVIEFDLSQRGSEPNVPGVHRFYVKDHEDADDNSTALVEMRLSFFSTGFKGRLARYHLSILPHLFL